MAIHNKRNILWSALLLSGAVALSGCNSSSDDNTVEGAAIEGSIFAAPVSAASISVFDLNGNRVAGPVTSGADGHYQITIPDAHLASDLSFISSGGTFTDEATGEANVSAGQMSVYVAADSLAAGSEVHATPSSTIMHQLIMQHGQGYVEAQAAFESAFGYQPDYTVAPTDATAPAADATDQQMLAGLRAASFSQLAQDLGMSATDQFALLEALALDLSDGELDGQSTSGAVILPAPVNIPLQLHIQHQFAMALEGFHRGGRNATSLNASQIGVLPFAKVASSESYRFEYQPGMMPAMEGKTTFKIVVTDAATGQLAQGGLNLILQAKMYMATKMHATPVDGCSESATAGVYDCTIFYLMPSVMNGMSMGYWELMVTTDNNEMVSFYPGVGMGMNGNGKRSLMAQSTGTVVDDAGLTVPTYSDFVMSPTSARKYLLFKDSIAAGSISGHKVRLFIAVKESMDSFPALYTGASFNMASFTVSSINAEFSVDGASWSPMTEEGAGYWSVDNAPGLVDGVENTFYMRLHVNGEQKTANGSVPALDGSNDYAIFTTTLN
ncbi:MAG: hypothetical protein L3J94_01120 [Gammaproteobacteria bacterium]|nr:hypothetical protein [Gammaproteobacteria bacterium]